MSDTAPTSAGVVPGSSISLLGGRVFHIHRTKKHQFVRIPLSESPPSPEPPGLWVRFACTGCSHAFDVDLLSIGDAGVQLATKRLLVTLIGVMQREIAGPIVTKLVGALVAGALLALVASLPAIPGPASKLVHDIRSYVDLALWLVFAGLIGWAVVSPVLKLLDTNVRNRTRRRATGQERRTS